MTEDLISRLRERGVRLRLVGDRLSVHAPVGALTEDLRTELRQSRQWLVEMLRRTEAGVSRRLIEPQPGHRHEPFPLTDIQHAYWVGRQSAVELGGVSAHFYLELERRGLDPDRLTESLRKVIDRHDMLRAVITPDGQQRVLPEVPAYEIAVVDLRSESPEQRLDRLASLKEEMGHQVRPADRWPLFDIRASLLDDHRLRLHVSLDLLIMDAASLFLLFRDWRRWYEEPDWAPAPLELSYRDCVLEEAAQRDSDAFREAERYWSGRLDDLPPAPALPLAIAPSQITKPRFSRLAARLPAARWARIKQEAQRNGLTPSATLMTCFADVLGRWSGQPELTLNLTLFNRPRSHPEIDQLIGDFTGVTLLAVQPDPAEPFASRAARLQLRLMEDLEHAAVSGVRVLRQRARRLGAGPAAVMPVVFTSALALQDNPEPTAGMRFFGDLTDGISQTPQVWLDHQVSEQAGDLAYNWDAVAELFPAGLLDDMFAAYQETLDRLADGPEAWLKPDPHPGLPAWQDAERLRANETRAELPGGTLGGLVEARARSQPDAPAIVDADGSLSFGELITRARRLARRLTELGATRGKLVAIVLGKGREQAIAAVGVCLSGAAYLPIDPRWPLARQRQVLEQGDAEIVITTAERVEELRWRPGVRLITPGDAEVQAAACGPLATEPSPQDLAYVIFTSGSTGQPKGVMIDHRGAVNTIADINSRFQVGPDDSVLALSALSFDLSVYDIFGVLAAGGTVVMPSPGQEHDPAHWTSLIHQHKVTVWNSVPALMQAWLDAGGLAAAGRRDQLRLVLLSGDWIPVSLPAAIRAEFPAAAVISLGGATEASIWSVIYPVGDIAADSSRIPYGKPLANQVLRVYDARLAPSPVWVTGEIYIGGAGLAIGYWGRPDLTAERFITHPATGERLYRTGDLGRYLPGGDIDILGRCDNQVKINGYRVEVDEIAAALCRLPEVATAVVTADASPRTGRRQLVGYVVPQTAAPVMEPDGEQPGWADLIALASATYQRQAPELASDLASFHETWKAMERMCLPVMALTLARLGVFTQSGDQASAEQIARRCGLKPAYQGLLRQWLRALADGGILRESGPGTYRGVRALNPGQLAEQVELARTALSGTGHYQALTSYFLSCADRQAELLRGEVSPLELLISGDDWGTTEVLYSGNPVSRLLNQVAASTIRDFARRSSRRPVRILEVGAGTGGTSQTVLAALAGEEVRYRFTDISTFFTERARSRFSEHSFIEFGVLDIDRDPVGQGHPPGSAEIVLAANVMHDAKDLQRSLNYLRSVLAPGGLLALIEGTANSLPQLITVGFIEGFSHHEASRDMPLLSASQWHAELTGAGFDRFAAVPEIPADVMPQQVLLARAPADRLGLDPGTLRESLGGLLPDYMVPQHFVLLDQLPLNPNGKVDRSSLPRPWDDLGPAEPVAARSDLEQRLLTIWHEALRRDDFGVGDNFFELGGDSLHALRILTGLRDDLGLRENADEGLQILFANPTVAGLAKALENRD